MQYLGVAYCSIEKKTVEMCTVTVWKLAHIAGGIHGDTELREDTPDVS